MSEIDRFRFLVNRDGLSATIEWYRSTTEQYLKAAEMALQEPQKGEKVIRARGKYWSELYLQAAIDCDELVALASSRVNPGAVHKERLAR